MASVPVIRHHDGEAIVASVQSAIGDSLFEAFSMFWETLWALVLGFVLSGAVQAFVARGQMQRGLGDHRPGTVGRAGFFGMVSSSCSYAAVALAKSLFARGADFTSAIVFMVASTNLVVELGIGRARPPRRRSQRCGAPAANILALIAFAALYGLYRTRARPALSVNSTSPTL